MRIFKIERARVSQQCKSAESKLVLTITLTEIMGKGKRLIFRYYMGTCGTQALSLKLWNRLTSTIVLVKKNKSMEYHNDEKLSISLRRSFYDLS